MLSCFNLLLYLRGIKTKYNRIKEYMKRVSSDIKWFCDQLRQAELILSNALEKAEEFSEHDKKLVDRIESDVQMVDLTLLQLLSPIAPR